MRGLARRICDWTASPCTDRSPSWRSVAPISEERERPRTAIRGRFLLRVRTRSSCGVFSHRRIRFPSIRAGTARGKGVPVLRRCRRVDGMERCARMLGTGGGVARPRMRGCARIGAFDEASMRNIDRTEASGADFRRSRIRPVRAALPSRMPAPGEGVSRRTIAQRREQRRKPQVAGSNPVSRSIVTRR